MKLKVFHLFLLDMNSNDFSSRKKNKKTFSNFFRFFLSFLNGSLHDFTGLDSNGLSVNDYEQNLNLFIHVLPPKVINWGNNSNRFFQCSAAFNRCSWRRPTDAKLKIWTFLSLNDKFLRLRLRLDYLDKKPWSYHLELYKYIVY